MTEGQGRGWRRRLTRHPVRRGATLILLALILEYLVLPQVAGVRASLHVLATGNLWLVTLGVGLEVASLACYAQLTRTVLPPGSSRFSRIWRIDLASLSASHVLPGGTAGGGGSAYRLLTNEGVAGSDVGVALAIQGIGSAVVLNVILWLALVVSIPATGFNAIYGTAAILGALLIAAFAGVVLLLTKGEERAAVALRTVVEHLPFVKDSAAEAADRVVHQLAARLRELGSDRALLRRAVLWAAANWLLDAASLFAFLAAFGQVVNPDALLVAYGLAFVLAALPVTPGGLGVVEGVLVPSLVGFGSPRRIAIVAVIAYRLVNFWLPIPVGGIAYLSLAAEGSPGKSRRQRLTGAVEEARAAIHHEPGVESAGGR